MSEITPFSGFPGGALEFLTELDRNNNREWFEAHKGDYRTHLLEPAQAFVAALGERLRPLFPGITYDTRTNGGGSIMRIYRDLRFSKDKTPYNPNLRVVFWQGAGKKTENPGYFFGMDAQGAVLCGGMHTFPKSVLTAYQSAVADDMLGPELEAVLESLRSAGAYQIGGEQYKRLPAGYDPDQARADLLRYKGLFVKSPKIEPAVLVTPALVEVGFEHCRNMGALHNWLVRVNETATSQGNGDQHLQK
jgi:uncharacterized protein (TIGR02453 family)